MPPKVSAHDHIAGQSTAFNLGCYRLRVDTFQFAGSLKKENRKSTENNKKR